MSTGRIARTGQHRRTRRFTIIGGQLALALGLALLLGLSSGVTRAQAVRPESSLISTDYRHSCALTPAGAADCWGDNRYGQAEDQPGPFIAVGVGLDHSCALTPVGAVDCWGRNNAGQATDQAGPYSALSVGSDHNCALTQAGAADCWGYNAEGGAEDQAGPYSALSAAYIYTCALTEAGAVDCWGRNFAGQAEDQLGPYVAVSAGYYHTCALTPVGAADCWGRNDFGEAEDQIGPFIALSAGDDYTCALTPAGGADCWGENRYGQAEDQPGPYTAIDTGDNNTCALTPDGMADCWGDNRYGQSEDQPGPYGAYDTTPPSGNSVIDPAPNAAGWNNSAVTITWNWSDNPGGSGLDPDRCTTISRSSGEGVQTLGASCQDLAGNGVGLAEIVRVDTTAPTLSPLVAPNPVQQGGQVSIRANAQDALSGVGNGGCDGPVTSTPGTFTVSCSVSDLAGNRASASVQYTVLPAPTPTPTTPAFPSNGVLDSFNRANGAVGASWEGLASSDFYRIASQRLDVQNGGPLVWKPASFGTTQEAYVTLSTIDARSPSQGVLLKVQAGSVPDAGAIAVVYDAPAKAVRVSTLRVGARTWTLYAKQSATFANGDRLGAQVRADGTVRIYRNATLLVTGTLSAQDQAFFNAKGGKIGVWSAGAANAVLDDFGGGSVVP